VVDLDTDVPVHDLVVVARAAG
ncbi:MAG: hypothetical protein QOH45_2516, partial [Pseudonocardiales bacterium]|nr:hypothetical protein [Pseudonocardiales bacterium]